MGDEGVPRRRAEKGKAEAAQQQPAARVSQDLAVGEVSVTYDGEKALVRWLVDLKNFTSSRHRSSKRFTLTLWGEQVPFMFMLNPRDTSGNLMSRSPSGSKKS